MKAIAASRIVQYEKSVRALADCSQHVGVGEGAVESVGWSAWRLRRGRISALGGTTGRIAPCSGLGTPP